MLTVKLVSPNGSGEGAMRAVSAKVAAMLHGQGPLDDPGLIRVARLVLPEVIQGVLVAVVREEGLSEGSVRVDTTEEDGAEF